MFLQKWDSNCRPLLLEATALATAPDQLLIVTRFFVWHTCQEKYYFDNWLLQKIDLTRLENASHGLHVRKKPEVQVLLNILVGMDYVRHVWPGANLKAFKVECRFPQLINKSLYLDVASSVTRLGDLLDFGQLFKAFGNNYFPQISHILRQFL